MTKAERQKKYKQIADLAEWVSDNRAEVAMDGMSIVIGVAENEEKAKKMCMIGKPFPLYAMLETFREKLGESLAEQFKIRKAN